MKLDFLLTPILSPSSVDSGKAQEVLKVAPTGSEGGVSAAIQTFLAELISVAPSKQ